MNEKKLKQLRAHMSSVIKNGHESSDFRCTDCGVGIEDGEETYVITPPQLTNCQLAVSVLCVSCTNDFNL